MRVTKPAIPASFRHMVREISAGGVVIRPGYEGWEIAVIEPQKEAAAAGSGQSGKKNSQKVLLALPKGLVDPGEKAEQTALREVLEETGINAVPITKLGDTKYVYVRSWGDGERVFKIVSFYLLRYESGEIGDIPSEMKIEVRQALWVPLEEAARKLAYGGEKQMVKRAIAYLEAHPELRSSR